LYIFQILTVADKKSVVGQSETLREVGVSVYPEAFSLTKTICLNYQELKKY